MKAIDTVNLVVSRKVKHENQFKCQISIVTFSKNLILSWKCFDIQKISIDRVQKTFCTKMKNKHFWSLSLKWIFPI